MRRPRPTRVFVHRPWYRIDVWSALERLHQYFSDLLQLQPDRSFTVRGFLSDLLNLDPARRTSDRPVTFKPELTPLELRWLMDARPLPHPVLFAGGGSTPAIVAYAADTGEEIFSKLAYEESFTGGVRVAAADFTRDGWPDLLVGPGPGGAPNVKVLDGKTGNPIAGPLGSFWAFEPWFNGGVNVAAADVDGDAVPDAIFTAGIGGGPRVRVLSGKDGHEIANFFALDPDFRGGISVAAADLTGDGRAEIAIGAGEGGGPRVRVYDGATMQPLAGPLGSFFAFDADFRGGVFVGADGLAGDLNADGIFDLAVSAGPGMASAVTVFSGATGDVLLELSPFGSFAGGVRTALAYVDNDEFADLVTGSGPGMVSTVRVFSGVTGEQLDDPIGEYVPFGSVYSGVTVAASNDPPVVTVEWVSDGTEAGPTSGYVVFTRDVISDPLAVNYSVGGTATSTVDYSVIGSRGFFPFGDSQLYLAVASIDDAANEGTETVIVTLQTGGYTIGSPSSATVNIIDDDGGGGLPPPPQAPVITGFNDDTGTASDYLTNDPTLTVFGTAPASSPVYLYERLTPSASLAPIGNTTASAGGLWTITYATPLAEGPHEFVAMPASTAPIYSPWTASAPYHVTIDATAPAVWLTAPSGTYETVPEVRVGGWDLHGLATTVVLDVDLDNDSNFTDPGEAGYAAGTLLNGSASFTSYTPLTVGNTVRMRARLLDAAGNEGISSTSTVTVNTSPTNYPVSPPIVPATVSPPFVPTAVSPPFVPATVSAAVSLSADGTVTTFVPVDVDRSPSPATGTPAGFLYVSSQTGLAPTVGLQFQSNNALAAPTQIVATLTWDGASAGGTTFSGTGLVPGALWMVNLQPAANQSTGLHTYSVDAFLDFPGTINDTSVSTGPGSTFVVNRSSGVNGAGWAYSDVDQLATVTGGKMRVHGNGQWSFYATSGGGYDSPPGDAGTLAAAGGGGFTYTLPSGEQRVFDSSGYQTKWVAFDGSATITYTYDGSNRLETVQSPDGGLATFAYSAGLLQTLTAPGNRVTTFSYSGTDLTLVTDPAGGTHTLAYDGSHRLTDEQWGNLRTTYGYLSGMGVRRSSGAEVNTVQPVLGASLTDPMSRDVYVLETDGLGNTTRTLLDDLGYPVKRIDPDGATWAMTRDGDGRLATITDPLNRTTTYTRDGDGYVTAIQNPDGTRATFTYQVGHHALTTAVDELSRTTSYAYTGNGNLETITDAASGVTTLTWSGGLLQTITDPLGRVVTQTYDSYRRLTNALVGAAQTGTMLYDARGYSAGITDPLNATTTIVNDAVGRPVSLTTPDGATTTAMYDAAGLTVASILPSGLRTSFAYNAAGRQTETIEGVGSGLERRTTSVYDAAGHRIAVIDPLGQRTTATYDGVGRTTAVTNPLLETNQTRYDLAGRIISTLDPLGRVTQYGYDTRDRLITVTDPLGNVTSSVYDAVGNTVAVVDPLGHRSTAVYDALNRVIASVDPLGNRATAVYDAASQLLASVDPLGNRTTTAYDARGNVRTVTDPFLNVTTATYDAADRLVAVTDPLNRTSTSVYDTVGRVIASVDPLGNRTTAVYDSAGRLSASIDPLGNRTTAVYDALDRVSATIDALNQRTTAVYDALDRVVANIDPLGHRTTATFDAANRVVAMTDPLNHTSTVAYDAAGNVLATTDPRGNVTGYAWNGNNLLANVVDPLGNLSTTVYDAASRPVAAIDPLTRTVTAVYDDANRLSAVIDPLGNRTTAAYDAASNLVAVTDALNHTVTWVYDALNRPIATVDALGNRTTAVYDAAGQFSASIDALNRRTTAVYDDASRLVAVVDPLGNRTTAVYDAASNPVASIDALNHRTTAVYDALNRPVATIDALGNRATVAYDAAGRVQSVTDPLNHRVTFNYDAAGRNTSILDGLEKTWQTVYDDANNPIASIDPLGNRTTAVYDAANRFSASVDALGNRSTVVYDAAGQVIAGINALGNRATMVYDAAGRVTGLIDPLGNRSTVVYDAVGNIASVTDPLGNRSTTVYDAADRMIASIDALANRTTMAYDAVGNVLTITDALNRTTSFSYDDLDRLVTTIDPLANRTTAAYDSASNLVSVTDPLNHTTSFAYDVLNRATEVTDALGNRATAVYDAAGNVIASVDPLGRRTTISYDARNSAVGVLDALGNRTTAVYDDAGNTTAVIDALGRRTTSVYDALNRVSASIDALGNRTTAAYDAAGQLTSITDALGRRTTAVYDAAGRMTTIIDALGNRATSVYDEAGNRTVAIDQLGSRTTVAYDTRNMAVAVTDPVGNRSTAVYDAVGNLAAVIDPLGNRTTSTYDARNALTAVTDPLNHTTTLAYDAAGNLRTITNPLNHTGTFGYDAVNRQITITNPLGDTATTAYDAVGNAIAFTDPLGNTSTVAYDALDRAVSFTDPLNHTNTTVYDAVGNATAVIDALGFRTTAVYDALDRVSTLTRPTGAVSTVAYDAVGNRISVTDPLNHTSTFGFDALNRQTTVTDALGFATTAVYDAASRMTSLIDPVGNRTTWAYDAASRVTTQTDPLNQSVTFAYDALSRVASRTDRLGRRIDYAYDAAGRNTAVAWYAVGGGLSQTQTYAYDAANQLTAAVDPDGTYTLAYDAAGRVSHVDEPFGLGLTFDYDKAGNRVRVEDSLGGVTTSVYDAANRLTMRELGGTGITAARVDYGYTARNETASVTRYSDLAGTAVVATTNTTYDAGSRAVNIQTLNDSSAVLANYTYTYDAADRITSKIENGTTTAFNYDVTNQLTQDGASNFSYDGNGNRTMAGYTTGGGNRTSTDGTWTFTYDAEGNVTKKSKGAASDTWVYSYDHNNQMTGATYAATDGGTVTQRTTYAYDAFGNRIQRQGWDGTTATTQRYGLDGWDTALPAPLGNENFNAWADLDGSSTLTDRHLYGNKVGAPVARETAGGAVSWNTIDLQGSVRLVLDGTGTITSTLVYDAFGKLVSGIPPERFAYATLQRDAITGLMSAGNGRRDDDPETAKWQQEDPWGFGGGDANLRSYVGNNATNAIDPSGNYLIIPQSQLSFWQKQFPSMFWYEDLGNGYIKVTIGNAHRNQQSHDTIAATLSQLGVAGSANSNFSASNHLHIALVGLYEGSIPGRTDTYQSSTQMDAYILFPGVGMDPSFPSSLITQLRNKPAFVARNAASIGTAQTREDAARRDVEIRTVQRLVDLRARFDQERRNRELAESMGRFEAVSPSQQAFSDRLQAEERALRDREAFSAFVQRSVFQANPTYSPNWDLLNRVDERYRAEERERYHRLSGLERQRADLLHETLWLIAASLAAPEIAALRFERSLARLAAVESVRDAQIMRGLARDTLVAPAAGARLSPAQQAVFDEVRAIPGIDCERAMLEFQRRLPDGRRVSFGGRCDHHVWVHDGKVLDPTASQYLGRWPKNLLDREPGLEQAIRSGVFTPEQHATFMSRVSGEEITAASYLQRPR